MGLIYNNKSFFIAFAFLPGKTEAIYIWALEQVKELYGRVMPASTVMLTPEAISTNCDRALRNAILKVFPSSAGLLCILHANKNIQQHCKGKFISAAAWKAFLQV